MLFLIFKSLFIDGNILKVTDFNVSKFNEGYKEFSTFS